MHGFVDHSPLRGGTDLRSQDMLERVAEALGVDVGWFFTNQRPARAMTPEEPSTQLKRVVAAFSEIEAPEYRAAIVELLESHASIEEYRRSREGRTR